MACGWSPGAVTVWRTTVFLLNIACTASAKRHVVYWNSTNSRLTGGDLSIQVNLNDYLDIYCPHYPHPSPPSEDAYPQAPPDSLALYLVAEGGFRGCVETQGAIKRWECNSPHAPFGPVRFSEKIQRFTPFSLGFEFLPGHHYYYSSLPTGESSQLPCMKLRVTVCCEPTTEGSKQNKQEQGTPALHSDVCSMRTVPLSLLLLLIPLLNFLSI
ncbi:ephrin-A4 isoform X1 [Salmo salar]|uniref:Ephrin-A4 isoform X1 n=1 Tax=Salmo salar TaxID=8030 RepID=A0ABM3D7H5_SALSA|nr:ephrin-A4-like isoform X1 [Salmo salar]|eukprot:XP_014057410.1 PREDICTED: ephrin-A4-like [Salmo salar]